MTPHLTLRPVEPHDAAAIAAIYNHYILRSVASFETEALDEAEMRRRILAIAARHPYFVCETEGEVAGYCYAHPWKERAAYRHTLETTVYVAPGRTGLGIGRRLMEHLVAACRATGDCHALVACITADNTPSIALHRALGFRCVSHFEQVGRKFGRWLGVVDYELLLD